MIRSSIKREEEVVAGETEFLYLFFICFVLICVVAV
jgi:hypothetical protein